MLALDPAARVYGLGGERFRAAGGDVVADYRGLTVTGLSEALAVLPRSYATYRQLIALARRDPPDVFVPIDFPDFNFRLAAALRRLGVPVVYYVCPQVWAWRRRRLFAMKRLVRRALVIFPFEDEVYREVGVPVEFVGHPLVDLAIAAQSREDFRREQGLDAEAPTVALLPGSRPNEVRAIWPVLVRAIPRIVSQVPGVQFVVARAPNLDDELFSSSRGGVVPPSTHLVEVHSRTDDVLQAADVVVTASGTATVQTALHERPMVIVYRLSPLTYRLVKAFAHVDAVGMANLIAGEPVVPELVQDALTDEAVAHAVVAFFRDVGYAERTRAALRTVRLKLGAPGASRRAAEAILGVAQDSAEHAGGSA